MFCVFRIDSHFDCMSMNMYIFLCISQMFSCGDTDLFTDQIDSCNPFSHWMLYLNSCVHLNKIEISMFVT